ncbi:hypothetical protein QTQ03_24435 [Micromonospora sp. WMMA1363]|uniref:hypothetical protein n=1 Tax=Micromonospora sp. WMMA1363 TaxID=3053985 RepID=UPI00259CEC81|nr:hypothetical protein [Micromonospora sp. WMMA1363]MDM4722586.1 hypothetical protein [Micromonospora sp. WMMA1363]
MSGPTAAPGRWLGSPWPLRGAPTDVKRPWPRLTRRQTLTAAASATLGAAALTVPGLSAAQQNASGTAGGADDPIVVHLRDAATGTMDVFVGTSRIEVRDRGLADRLRRAARR